MLSRPTAPDPTVPDPTKPDPTAPKPTVPDPSAPNRTAPNPATGGFAGWALDPGTLGFALSFEQYLTVTAEAGYDWVEVPVAELVRLGPAALRNLCDRHGVRPGVFSCPWSGPYNGSVDDERFERRLRELPALLDLVAAAGGERVSAFFNGAREGMRQLGGAQLAERCGRLAQTAARHGVRFCLELNDPHHLRAAATVLAQAAGSAGGRPQLLVDTFHLFRAGCGPDWIDALPAGAIGWMHVSGVPLGTGSDADSGPRTAPFRGHQDTGALLDAAHRAGYRGPLSIEVLPSPAPGTDRTQLVRLAADLLAAGRNGLAGRAAAAAGIRTGGQE
ncbi:TIM barrel protein [Kitasatospora sp. NPDC048194]|uniref:sugar phosphate isomerase/epimerase family protein n=1 Tax=Kitasatospora sp. NPDC048194 TaxID=3364045 RepID=UPI0037182BDA